VASKSKRAGRPEKKASPKGSLPESLNREVRKLKAVITLIIYGLLLLLIKTMYDTLVDVPHPSIVAIIILLAFMLVFSVMMFNRFSRRAITNIVESADAIQEARTYAETILDSMPIPLLVLDRERKVKTANPAFLSRFKCSRSEVETLPFYEFDNRRWNVPSLHPHLRTGEDGEYEDFQQLELEFSDDRIGHCHLLLGGHKVMVDGQELFLLAIEDVTARKMAEIALKDRTMELEVVNRAKSEFLANMSHELRTPLNAIIGFSEVLKDGIVDGELLPRQKEYVGDIFNSGSHLLSLINDILDMSKIEAGKMTLELEPAEISAICESALRVIREKVTAHGINLDIHVDREDVSVFLDIRKFRQIVYNLLSNAVKFTPDGGKVSLIARRVSARKMFERNPDVAPRWQGEYFLEVEVGDTGIGISLEDQKRLFEPFEQIDGSLSRKYEGTGLGLTMVKRLAELHGGWVTVFSRPGEGSRFTVYLPWRRDDGAESPTPVEKTTSEAHPDQSESLSLMLISRNEEMCKRLRDWSVSRGHGLEVLNGYAQAWEQLNRKTPSLLLLDTDYPDLEGIRMLVQIKGVPRFQTLPVVLLLEVTESGQGAVLAPAAVMLSPLSSDTLSPVLVDMKRRGIAGMQDKARQVLLVEADAERRQGGADLLRNMGWDVAAVSGGLAGVDATLRRTPDLIVVSAELPDISGFEMLHLLEESPETRVIPTILTLDASRMENGLQHLRPGLFALLSPGGMVPEGGFATALSRFFPEGNQ